VKVQRIWLVIAIVFYPLTAGLYASLYVLLAPRLDQFSALSSGVIVFLVLWLYALPREMEWRLGPLVWDSRFVLPLSAYLCGLVVASILMWFTTSDERTRSRRL
jgi:hypothetical protein